MNRIQNISRVLLCIALCTGITTQGAAALAAAPAGGGSTTTLVDKEDEAILADLPPLTEALYHTLVPCCNIILDASFTRLLNSCARLENDTSTFQAEHDNWENCARKSFPREPRLIHAIAALSCPDLLKKILKNVPESEVLGRYPENHNKSLFRFCADNFQGQIKVLRSAGFTPNDEDIQYITAATMKFMASQAETLCVSTKKLLSSAEALVGSAKDLVRTLVRNASCDKPKVSYVKTAAKKSRKNARAAAEAAAQAKEESDVQALADEEARQKVQAQRAKQQTLKEAAAKELQAKLKADEESARLAKKKAEKKARQAEYDNLCKRMPNLEHFFDLDEKQREIRAHEAAAAEEALQVQAEKQRKIDAQKERRRTRKAAQAAIDARLAGLGTIIGVPPQSFAPAGLVTPGPEERAKRVQEVDHSDVEINPEAMRMYHNFERARAQYLQQALHRPALTK
jgi:hypothetical protein